MRKYLFECRSYFIGFFLLLSVLSGCGGKSECETGSFGFGPSYSSSGSRISFGAEMTPDPDRVLKSATIAFVFPRKMEIYRRTNGPEFEETYGIHDEEFQIAKESIENAFGDQDDFYRLVGTSDEAYWVIGTPMDDGETLRARVSFCKDADGIRGMLAFVIADYEECYRVEKSFSILANDCGPFGSQ
jgi:hypothetical protein